MIGQTTVVEKSVKCAAAVTAFTVAKLGADDDTLAVAAAVSDSLVGIFQHATQNAGEEVRVMVIGISRAKCGETITRGQKLTVDASGQVVAAAPATGVNNHIIGLAMASGVSGDIVPVLLSQSVMQG